MSDLTQTWFKILSLLHNTGVFFNRHNLRKAKIKRKKMKPLNSHPGILSFIKQHAQMPVTVKLENLSHINEGIQIPTEDHALHVCRIQVLTKYKQIE